MQGLIRDVWVFSKNDAWAVGEIYLADSTGKPDIANRYNAAHWDGSKWELKQINFIGICSGVNQPEIWAVWAFSKTNILFTNGGSIVWYDGMNAALDCGMNPLLTGAIRKIYATDSGNIFAVGNKGTIVHYSNGMWTKHNSNTTVNLQDVWGIDNEHVWATGTNNSDGHSVLLQYDGKQWSTLYDNSTATPSTLHYFSTLWTDNTYFLYLSGGGLRKMTTMNNNFGDQINTGQQYPSYRVRATSRRDIFNVGQASEVAHYNGIRWYLFPELKTVNDGFAWFYGIHPTKDFVLIGGVGLTTLNGYPIVIRGYR